MPAKQKKHLISKDASESVRAFSAAAIAVAKLRNDIPDRQLVDSITKDGSTRGDGLVVLTEILDSLADSGRVYAHNDDIILTDAPNTRFRILAADSRAEPKSGAMLMNLIAGVQYKANQATGELDSLEFCLPDKICDQLFAMDRAREKLPRVVTYATHSVFDEAFCLHGPGYHADEFILVQGTEIRPDVLALPAASAAMATSVSEALTRLPRHLRHLFMDFDWAGVVDLTNVIGTLLMGLLMNLFVDDGHPAVFIRGNQPSIGKSLLARVIAMIFDGRQVSPSRRSSDEEFDKLLCSLLKKRYRTILLDNLRSKIDSERIEQIITSPTLLIRLLGTNEFGEWRNDVLFLLTSNSAIAGRDLVSRNLVIDLYTEGDPKRRQEKRKQSDPLQYAETHRGEILGELAALVLRWVDAGRPEGELTTRFDKVSQIIGGILDANGLQGFASNAEVAAVEMDEDLQRMLELVEEVLNGKLGNAAFVQSGEDSTKAGLVAGAWVPAFERLHLIDSRQNPDATERSKTVTVGKVFSRYVDSPISFDGPDGPIQVVLHRREAAGNKKFYFFETAPMGNSVIDEAQKGPEKNPNPVVTETKNTNPFEIQSALRHAPKDSPKESANAPTKAAARRSTPKRGWMGVAESLVTPRTSQKDES
jgi:hypothetical protein